MAPRVLFVCRNFHRVAGGVERMATQMMNEMVARGLAISLITWDQPGAEPHYELHPAIEWVCMGIGDPAKKASWRDRHARLRLVRRHARSFGADAVIAFQAGCFFTAKAALLGLGVPVIAAERNSPQLYDFIRHGGKLRLLVNLILRSATVITVQMDSYRRMYPAALRSKIVVIPNPVTPLTNPPYPNDQEPAPRLVLTVGRLSYQKNQEVLLRAFARVSAQRPDWRLALVGDGEHREALERLAGELDLGGSVIFAGAVRDVSAWYARAAIFAFPSRWEGFPNALAEAMSAGVPAIGPATTCGINEMIEEGVTGLLPEATEEAFADALLRLIDAPDLRQVMGKASVAAMVPYLPATIFDQWEVLFRDLAARPRGRPSRSTAQTNPPHRADPAELRDVN